MLSSLLPQLGHRMTLVMCIVSSSTECTACIQKLLLYCCWAPRHQPPAALLWGRWRQQALLLPHTRALPAPPPAAAIKAIETAAIEGAKKGIAEGAASSDANMAKNTYVKAQEEATKAALEAADKANVAKSQAEEVLAKMQKYFQQLIIESVVAIKIQKDLYHQHELQVKKALKLERNHKKKPER